MRPKQACAFAAAALLTLTMAFGRAPAAEKVPGDRLLPPDTYLFVEVPSVPELKARMGKTSTGQLVGEPALADFWKDVEAQLDKISEQVEGQVGVSLKTMLSIPSGQLSIAVTRAGNGEVGLVAILDYGDNGSTVDKLLATANEKLQEKGAEKSETDVDGTKVTVHTMTEKKEEGEQGAEGEKPESHTLVWFNKDNHLVVSSGLEHVKSVLARWDGKHSSTFADAETHKYISTRCKTSNNEPSINWFINPVSLIQAVVETAAKENLQAQMALSFLPRLGIAELKAIGGSVDMNAGEFDTVSRTMIYVEGDTHGILDILHFPETELAPPKWVTSSATSYVSYNWDVLGAYGAVEELVDGLQGPGTLANLVESLAQQPGGPQIHLKKDFLDHLTGRVHMIGAAPKEGAEPPAEGEAPVGRVLFAFDAKNADKLKSALDSVAKLPDFNAKTHEVSGTTVYEFSTGVGAKSAAAVVDNALMFTSDVSMIEAVIRGDSDQQPLSESPEYRKIASHFPTKASAIGYEKQDAQIETVYEMVRSGKSPLPPGSVEIDFSKLPPFAEIKKYLSPTGSYAIPDQHGAYYESFTLPKGSSN